jgi:chromosome partitioning protein
MKPVIISIANCKGGVAKTSSTINLGAGLSMLGKKVLLIDLDTQANLTHSLIGDLPEGSLSITEAILNEKNALQHIVKHTHVNGVDIAPAGWSMVDLELKLHSAFGRESLLKRSLSNDFAKQYDFIIIDNGPHVGLKVVNSLVASNYYLTPVSAEYLPLVGIKHLINVIEQIRPLNTSIANLGYLITMVDKREGIAGDVENILRENFKDDVFKTVIRINTKLKAAPQKKQTIFQAETSKGKGYTDYLNAAKELLQRVGQ